jgi:hypothetical protein
MSQHDEPARARLDSAQLSAIAVAALDAPGRCGCGAGG